LSDNEILALSIGFGTVLGSLIGAFISTFLGRAQKISTFRQEWINSIREVFSTVLLKAEVFTDVAYQDNEEAYREKVELIKAISKAKLFLNLREEESKTLIELIESIPDEYMGKKGGSKEFKAMRPKIEKAMRYILKEEWNRVRDGEALWKFKKVFKPGGFLQEFYCSRLVVIILMLISMVIFVKLVKCT
jgi:hypothetical protein